MEKMDKREVIKWIYLYLFSTIGLVLFIIGAVRLVDLGLKSYIFKKADQIYSYPVMAPYPKEVKTPEGIVTATSTKEEEAKMREDQMKADKENRASQRQRDAASSVAMILIGAPLYFYHRKKIQEDKNSRK